MRDEQHCQIEFPLQRSQKIDDLRLYGDIQGSNRLITYKEFRLCQKGTADAYALELSARELVGMTAQNLLPKTNLLQHRKDALLLFIPAESKTMDTQRLCQKLPDRLLRIE